MRLIMTNTGKKFVFFIYHLSDTITALEMKNHLNQHSFSIWDPHTDMIPGQNKNAIWNDRIAKAEKILIVFSENTIDGQGAFFEMVNAAKRRQSSISMKQTLIVPVFLSGCSPPLDFEGLAPLEWNHPNAREILRSSLEPQPQRNGEKSEKIDEINKEIERLYKLRAGYSFESDGWISYRDKIIKLKRELRVGGRLQPGFFLANRYELKESIGRGGFARVWRAYDTLTRSMVAVKVLHTHFAEDKTVRDRFFRGAATMKTLNERRVSGIVQIRDPHGEDEGYYFYVMEYLSGGNLREVVLSENHSHEYFLDVVLKAGRSLQLAHENGMVHRDIKPDNILLDHQGSPFLTDFDLVKWNETTGGTQTQAMGTYLYAAPELQADAKDVGPPSDIYSLAMTCVFMFYGKELPPMEVIRNPSNFINKLKVNSRASRVLIKALDWYPENRFSSVQEFMDLLSQEMQTNQKEPVQLSLLDILNIDGQPQLAMPWDDDYWVSFAPCTFTMKGWKSTVVLSESFSLGKFAVTNKLYYSFISDGGYKQPRYWTDVGWKWLVNNSINELDINITPKQEKHPVTNVSWFEANAFCKWLDMKLRSHTRFKRTRVSLPTEAEWEFAASGISKRRYPWGDARPKKQHANFLQEIGGTTPVDEYPLGQTPEGIYQLAGNAWEWCLDNWSMAIAPKKINPLVTNDSGKFVVRGGSWSVDASRLSCAHRDWDYAVRRSDILGFRICLRQL